jgi:anti-sigma B factor antagonist
MLWEQSEGMQITQQARFRALREVAFKLNEGVSMKIDSRVVGDVHFLDCNGRITLGEGTMAVRITVSDILKSGGKKIVLNLAGVNYIDSAGVGELVSTYTTVANQGGQLKLLCLTKKIRDVLAITKLLTVFQVYDSEPATVASFAG